MKFTVIRVGCGQNKEARKRKEELHGAVTKKDSTMSNLCTQESELNGVQGLIPTMPVQGSRVFNGTHILGTVHKF